MQPNQTMKQRKGMGKTGETYLVGNDKRLRSDSFLDPEKHSLKASFKGSIEDRYRWSPKCRLHL